jgi:hypothetical protein
MKLYSTRRIHITGHSLGGALAILAAYRGVEVGVFPASRLLVTTFGSPRVGNAAFAKCFNKIEFLDVKRVVSPFDAVPDLPPRLAGFRHVKGQFIPPAVAKYSQEDVRTDVLCSHAMTSYVSFFASDDATSVHRVTSACGQKQPDSLPRKLLNKALIWFKGLKVEKTDEDVKNAELGRKIKQQIRDGLSKQLQEENIDDMKELTELTERRLKQEEEEREEKQRQQQ